MILFSSTLPLSIFILLNGYFTLPIVDEQLSKSMYLPSNDDSTTPQTMNLRLVADTESTTWSDVNPKRFNNEHIGFEMSTPLADSEEEISSTSGSIEEFSSSEPMSMTIEQSKSDKRTQDDLFFTTILTTELPLSEKRDYDDSSSSSWESMISTTEQIYSNKRDDDDLSLTTVKPTTKLTQLNRQDFANELENDTQEMQVELTNANMLSFTSTISTNSEGEDLNESVVPTAVFDQQALNEIPTVLNDLLMLNESNDLIIITLSNQIFRPTAIHENIGEERQLTQGSTVLLFILAALLFSACVLTSTLVFAKTRRTLKRKSRITEMEAHLDEHYQHHDK